MTATLGTARGALPRPRAPHDAVAEVATDLDPAAPVAHSFVPVTRPSRRRGHRRLWAAGILTAVVIGGTSVGVDVLRAPDVAGPSAEQVTQALADLGWAQEAYHRRHDAYASSVLALVTVGWRPTPGIAVRVLDAGVDTFCLGAGGHAPSAWLTQDWALRAEPCV